MFPKMIIHLVTNVEKKELCTLWNMFEHFEYIRK